MYHCWIKRRTEILKMLYRFPIQNNCYMVNMSLDRGGTKLLKWLSSIFFNHTTQEHWLNNHHSITDKKQNSSKPNKGHGNFNFQSQHCKYNCIQLVLNHLCIFCKYLRDNCTGGITKALLMKNFLCCRYG